MHFHICGQELALISAIMPYMNMGYFYLCQVCGQVANTFRGVEA